MKLKLLVFIDDNSFELNFGLGSDLGQSAELVLRGCGEGVSEWGSDYS